MAAAGLAAEHGIGAGDVITWQLPTWLESMVLVGAISRLGATQNPVLPIYREREVGFCARQAGAKLLVVPSDFGGFDYVGMAEKIAAELGGVGRDDVRPLAAGGRPRRRLPAAPRVGRRRPLALLHLGHHGRSQGRPAHRPHRSTRSPRAWASGSR